MTDRIRTVGGVELPVSTRYLEASKSADASAEKLCKVCGNKGARVLEVTVATHIRPEHWNLLSGGFYFCPTDRCPVFYYNNLTGVYFHKGEVRTRFGPKEDGDPRPVCYCLGVLEEHIRYEILKKGCCDSLRDIEEFTKAGTGKWCLTTNPSGKCCREYLAPVVEKYLAMKVKATARRELEAVKRSLAEAARPAYKVYLRVEGMTCESCAVSVASALENAGGRNVRVSFREKRAELEATAATQPGELAKAVEDIGFTAKLERVERASPGGSPKG